MSQPSDDGKRGTEADSTAQLPPSGSSQGRSRGVRPQAQLGTGGAAGGGAQVEPAARCVAEPTWLPSPPLAGGRGYLAVATRSVRRDEPAGSRASGGEGSN